MKEKINHPPVFSNRAEKIKINSKAVAKTAFYSLLYAFCAYFLGGAELVFETFPLGLSFVCSVTANVPAAAAGAAIAAALSGDRAVVYISGLVVAVGFRYALSYALHKENIGFPSLSDGVPARMASAAAGAFTVSLIRIIYGGFRYYDLLAAVFFVLCCVGAVYAYSACLDRENEYTQKYEAGVAAFMFSAVTACGSAALFGVSLSVLTAFLLTLFTARKGGAMRGAVIGFLCGAATDLTLCPMFGIAGFICGLFSSFSSYVGVLFALSAGLFSLIYTGGVESLVANLPEAATAACLFLLLDYFKLTGKIRLFGEEVRSEEKADAGKTAVRDVLTETEFDLRRLSDAMRAVSEIASDLSSAERSADTDELSRLCAGVYSDICAECEKRNGCGARESVSRELFERTGAALYEKKTVSEHDLPKLLQKTCVKIGGAAVKINVSSARLAENRAKNDKAAVISKDAEVFAGLLKRIYTKAAEKSEENETDMQKLKTALYANAFSGAPAVCGRRKKYITAVSADTVRLRRSAKDIVKSFEASLSVKLTEPEITSDGKTAVFRCESRPVFACEAAKAEVTKENEIINGDTAFYLRGRDDYFYGAVCDGMGSGRDAALSSKLSGVVAEKLLHAGCEADDALGFLNHLLKQKQSECFSTFDMIRVDLLDGQAVFYKCGAAPSVLLRCGKVYRLASHTPPIGIMNELTAEKIKFSLMPGDVAVLMSDGVTEAGGSADWIVKLLSELDDTSPENVAGSLIAEAEKRSGRKDDMSVLAVKVRKI
ncbi:MAG: SpoIIE family protein phosphatase [Clostridia bacterium]|nr:SpoIIE family protein phosphatase [Clostridia bacterium]